MHTPRTLPLILSLLLLAACAKSIPQGPPLSASGAAMSTGSGAHVDTKEELEVKAATGDKNAQFELGALYHDGEGVPKDFAKAKTLFEKAAAQGEVRAQFNLGVMYYLGESVKQDYAEAKKWFDKAVALHNSRAEFNLGVMYYRGEGVPVDLKKAHDLFTRSAMQNFQEAQFNLGVMEAKGEGVEQDIGKAYAWFSLALENGNERAPEVIKNIERELSPEQLTIVKDMAEQTRKAVMLNVQQIMNAQSSSASQQKL